MGGWGGGPPCILFKSRIPVTMRFATLTGVTSGVPVLHVAHVKGKKEGSKKKKEIKKKSARYERTMREVRGG